MYILIELKDTLVNKPADEWLFGSDLEGRITVAKSMERSSLNLKQPKQKMKVVPQKPPLNLRGPPRPLWRAASQGGLPQKQQQTEPVKVYSYPNRQRPFRPAYQPAQLKKRY